MKVFPKIISWTDMSVHIKTLVICACCSSAYWIGSLVATINFLGILSDILNGLAIAS